MTKQQKTIKTYLLSTPEGEPLHLIKCDRVKHCKTTTEFYISEDGVEKLVCLSSGMMVLKLIHEKTVDVYIV